MSADIFVYLDTVQFSKNGVQNRNQVKSAHVREWLTIPVKHAHGQSIRDTQIADAKATSKHFRTLQANYARTPGFMRWKNELQELLNQQWQTLDQIGIASTEWMIDKLGISNKRLRASEIAGTHGKASELVASICEALNADTYLTGTGALAYLKLDDFKGINCEVQVQVWQDTLSYPQAYDEIGFVNGLSTLDLLLNVPEEAAQLISAQGSWERLHGQ